MNKAVNSGSASQAYLFLVRYHQSLVLWLCSWRNRPAGNYAARNGISDDSNKDFWFHAQPLLLLPSPASFGYIGSDWEDLSPGERERGSKWHGTLSFIFIVLLGARIWQSF